MTLTLIADDEPFDRCATCSYVLPERSPNSPAIRWCEQHWWDEQRRAHTTGEPVHPAALTKLERL